MANIKKDVQIFPSVGKWAKYVFDDGFVCFTNDRRTAMRWHREWVQKKQE